MNETELSSILKKYFNEIEKVYGEDMAYATAASSYDISESINHFSNGLLSEYDEEDICLELLISELLCNKGENLMVASARRVANRAPETYMESFENYPSFKPILLRSFIKNSSVSYNTRFEKLAEEDKSRVLDLIQKISSYQLNRKIEKQNSNVEVKQLLKTPIIM